MSASLAYDHAGAAIDWLCKAFGFEVQLKVEGDNGTIVHSELVLGGALISLGDAKNDDRPWRKSPQQLGGKSTCSLCFYIDDVDAHCERARKAGATIAKEPTTSDYGEDYWSDRSYQCEDPEGHRWWFCQRLRDVQ